MTRILVTGSRNWTNYAVITNAIMEAIQPGDDLLIVHGGCPDGADHIADQIARSAHIPTEVHPADWARHGRKAGPVRNGDMVRLGADICLAFIAPCTYRRCRTTEPHPSHGASLTANMAEKAGIPTRRYYA